MAATLERYPYSAIVDRPPLSLPDGARVAVFVVPNVEYMEWLPPANPQAACRHFLIPTHHFLFTVG